MTIFEFKDYKKYVLNRLHEMPKRGRGQLRRIAQHLEINSVTVTQVFSGSRNLTLEQATLLAEYFGLSELETEYLIELVNLERAGHHKLKLRIEKRLEKMRKESADVKAVVGAARELTDEDRGRFYSSWYYSGIRLLTSLPGSNTPDRIAAYFGLPIGTVNAALDFLLRTGLCIEENGRIQMGPSTTHLEASSHFIPRHHTNWRMKAIEHFEKIDAEKELSLSMPCSLAERDLATVRRELVATIDRVTKIIDRGPEEKLACFNIDWFML